MLERLSRGPANCKVSSSIDRRAARRYKRRRISESESVSFSNSVFDKFGNYNPDFEYSNFTSNFDNYDFKNFNFEDSSTWSNAVNTFSHPNNVDTSNKSKSSNSNNVDTFPKGKFYSSSQLDELDFNSDFYFK